MMYTPRKYIVLSRTPISRKLACLAVFNAFHELTNDFEVWIEPELPDEEVFVTLRENWIHSPEARVIFQ